MSPRDTMPEIEQQGARRSRLRRFLTRHLPIGAGGIALLTAIVLFVLYLWACSPQCERIVRRWLIDKAESATGGRVEIGNFTWRPLHLEADASGIVIHGLEASGEAPYAQIENLRVKLSILGLFSPKVLLRDLEVSRPSVHLIVYPDGSTNQPQPRRKKPGSPMMETLFNVKAGHIAVEHGVIDYDDRAASFDFQNRNAPFDFSANELSLVMRFVPAAPGAPEHYNIEAGASDLDLHRGARPSTAEAAHGHFEAALDLTRTAAYLRYLRLSSEAGKRSSHNLEITGTLRDFARPHWDAKAVGELDMRLLNPTTGFPFTPEGIAHVNLTGAGETGTFRADGSVFVENGAYVAPGVNATGVRLSARVHADPEELAITSVQAHLRQGGEIDGAVVLDHWLPPIPGAVSLRAHPGPARARRRKSRGAVANAQPPVIPVDGKVNAQLKGVSLDTILDVVGQPPFQRLGFDALTSGPATATWSHGNAQSVVVKATLALSPSSRPGAGETPVNGAIDATYTQRDGSVQLRNADLNTPGSHLQAHGRLGAYPIKSPSAIGIDLESHDLSEFDTVLRRLGLHRDGRTGLAAIPASLGGQAEFHGSWTGSLADPHLDGELKASQLTLDLPPPAGAPPDHARLIRVDSADVDGSYEADQISIRHALLMRGGSRVEASGTMRAAPDEPYAVGGDSILEGRFQVENLSTDDLQPFVAARLPVTGGLDAQLVIAGPLRAPEGSGWVQLNDGTLYGEPFTRARIQGSLAEHVLRLTSIAMSTPAGRISGSATYDLNSRKFQVGASGAEIEISRIASLQRRGIDAAGKLTFALIGSGTPDDPNFGGQVNVTGLALAGQRLGGLDLTLRTANHALIYDGGTSFEGASLLLHGQTALSGDYGTDASLTFSQFNVAALLKMAHVEGLTADSSLAGTINVEGPLTHPAQMRGEARLRDLAVTLAGVHLKSEGGLHATLEGNHVQLDPLHVTGEDTDLRAQGRLDLNGARKLDLSAQGSINLKLAETLDPDLSAAGTTTFQVEAHGPLRNPNLQGRIDFQNCSLSLGDLPNGLSQLHGTLVFNQNRLEVRTLTAMSGGGLLSVGGYLAYQHGIFSDLNVTGQGIRIRYPQGISSLADARLRLEGPQNNLLLSGDVLITRFTVSPDLDVAALAAQANAAVENVAPPEAPSNHIRLNVHVVSSPQLNFQNAYAKLAGDVDLRLRGTVANPSLLGRVSMTEGAATIAGTRYELERGDITFTNPVRIEPNIDLTATARVSDYDVTLDVHGTPARMTVNPRSDPPLPEADVISLLALGHTQNQERLYTAQQEQALTNPTTDALLGGALNATVSSRIQRLFGAGSVKIDPHYLGALGNSTSRITVQEGFGRNVTFTYATDVDTTGQQLLQAEIAINRHVSLLVARDESGVFSMVIKATRRYR
ncbi:MAG TPA: translocation/assembly module TamB domain-containing protein [Terracidiphilus sp.]|nr:translocation/assembly module TamB domain-containing protein [Terracidiphilus sp.]